MNNQNPTSGMENLYDYELNRINPWRGKATTKIQNGSMAESWIAESFFQNVEQI